MKDKIWVSMCVLGFALAAPASAQINIETEGKSVTIGPNGIFVQKGGKTVSIRSTPNKVSVKKTVAKPKPAALPYSPVPATKIQVQAQGQNQVPVQVANIEPIILNDNNINATMPMNAHKALIINGNNCTITLTGPTAGVIINGNSNSVSCDAVNTVEVQGNQNSVTWKKGLSGPDPAVVNYGNQNSLSRI
jgi:hypothetical protein